jgi:hypothetical protein
MGEGVLVANEAPYQNAVIVIVTHIRVVEGQGNAVLTIDGEPRTDLTLDPVNKSLGIGDDYKKIFAPPTRETDWVVDVDLDCAA